MRSEGIIRGLGVLDGIQRHPHLEDHEGIVGSHSLIPDARYHAFAAFGALMSPDLPPTRRQHE